MFSYLCSCNIDDNLQKEEGGLEDSRTSLMSLNTIQAKRIPMLSMLTPILILCCKVKLMIK